MTDAQLRIQALIQSILRYFEAHHHSEPGVTLLLDKIASMDLHKDQLVDTVPQGTRHEAILTNAIAGVTSPNLAEITTCLATAKDDLVWREDDALFYAPGADLGQGYKDCNLHTVLIGPKACGYIQPDFCMGLFMLAPHTLYRDHFHDAPEVYLNLSERTGWRFKPDTWQDYPAGSIVWNPPRRPHATRIYDYPFLSVFAWLEDIDAPCTVIPCNDWATIENALSPNQPAKTVRKKSRNNS